MKISSVVSLITLAAALAVSGCKSTHEEGVKSDILSQWTSVCANTEATTKAARAVLEDDKLLEIQSSSTELDGMAMGKKADGSKIEVKIKKEHTGVSQVSVSVGKIGDPKVGAAIAKRIKIKAEEK